MQATKTYNELTELELKKLIVPAGTTAADYKNFVVHYNKKGELIRVALGEFSETKRQQLKDEWNKPDAMDYALVKAGKTQPRQMQVFTTEERKAIRDTWLKK
jgi:hypothetical protein